MGEGTFVILEEPVWLKAKIAPFSDSRKEANTPNN